MANARATGAVETVNAALPFHFPASWEQPGGGSAAAARRNLCGPIAATKAVLPAMRVTGAGTLVDTTRAGSIHPDPQVADVDATATALRNWATKLHKELVGAESRNVLP